jgi:hypothetical protein
MTSRLLLPILIALPLAAQNPGPVGDWALVSAPDLAKVIATAIAPMNFIVRPIARARLAKTNEAYRTVRIQRESGTITITYDQRQPQLMPADGRAVDWTREDGEKFRISARMDQDDLVQTYQAEDGERTNVFHVDATNRTLTLAVTVASPRLPGPLRYTLTYR